MMNVKGYKRKGVLVFDSHIPIIWLLVVGGGYCLFPGVIDMPEKCKFTNLLCNESRLLKEDKIIILNIGNELRNRVAGGTFKYLNLQHDPVTDMNKLYWNEEIARKATMIVSSCPSTSESFIDSHTIIESGDNAIDQIKIENSIDPTTYQPDHEIPNCEVSSITYEEKLTQCAPQKIKERVIRFLSEYGLSAEGRQYDIRDFWIVNRYGEPKLTFRRHESSQLGCSFMIRVSETHYHAYLTCIHCSFNASLPTIGHPGENCPTQFSNLDAKYENLCSDSKNEYDNIEDDQSIIECKNETSLKTDSEGFLIETTESDAGIQGVSEDNEMKKDDNITSSISDNSEGGKSGGPATLLPGQSQSIVTSSCKTTIVERNKTFIEVSPAISPQVIFTSSQTPEPSETFSISETLSGAGDTTGTTSKLKILDKTESTSTTLIEEIPVEIASKAIDLTTELTDTSVISEKEISINQEATTSVYGSTASISTFGIADLKTVTSTIVPKEITDKKQSEDTSSIKPILDKLTPPIPTFESSLTGSSKFLVMTSTPSTAINSFSNTSLAPNVPTLTPLTITEQSTFTSVLWTSSKPSSITGSTLPPPTSESLTSLTTSSSSSAAALKDLVTTCKTTYIPSNKTYEAQNYTHLSSASSISAITQPSLNTVILSSTSISSSAPTNVTGLSTTITIKPELTTIISTFENSVSTEKETLSHEIKTTKSFDLTTRKFMTRKKPTIISTEIYSASTTMPTMVEATTQLTDKTIPSEFTKLNLSKVTEMKTTFTASTPMTTHTEYGKTSIITPISIISLESTRYGITSTTFTNISTDKTTEGGVLLISPASSVITSDIFKDHSTIMSTQTTTCRTTTIGINTSSTCKTTIPGSKSISISSIPSSSFSAQLPNQIISTSTTTYKTTIPTAKSSFISTKESTHISSLSITTDVIPASIGPAIQTPSVKTTEPTAMTTLPSTKFSSFSPGLNITPNIPPGTITDSSKITQATKYSISPITYFTSTVVSDNITDIAQAPSSPHFDSTSSVYNIPKITSTQTAMSKIEMPYKESIYPTSTTYRTTLEDKSQISTDIISLETAPTTISPIIISEILKVSKQTTSESIQSLAPISIISISTTQTPAIHPTTTCRMTDSPYEPNNTTCKTTIHARISSIAPISISTPVTSSKSKSEDIFISTILPQSTLSKSTFYEGIFHSSSISIPTTTTCKTTIPYTDIIPSTTTCRTTIPPTESTTVKTTCRITGSRSDSTILLSTTTCRTTTTSSLTTTCKTTIPVSKSMIEKISIFSEEFIDQMSTEMTVPTIFTDNITSSSSNTDISILMSTTYRPIIDTAKNTLEQWSQWSNIPTTTTCRTTLIKSTVPTVSSSTCKTTIHSRQSISVTKGSSAIASLLSKATDMIPESTASITESSNFQKSISLFPITTSVTIPQTQISISSPSIIPTSTTCKITTLLESTLPTLFSTTTCRTTLPTIKSSIPITTTCKTTAVIDINSVTTTCKIMSSTVEAAIFSGSSYQPVTSLSYTTPSTISLYSTTNCQITCATSTTSSPIIKSITTCPTTLSTSKIISTNLILPSTTIIPSTITCRMTGASDTCSHPTNTPHITTTCKTTLISAYPTTSTCKTTFMDRLNISTIIMQETTSPTKKGDMISTVIPLSSTLCKTDCVTGSTVTSTNIESKILPEEGIIFTSSEPTSLTKMNESYVTSGSTLLLTKLQTIAPTITSCKTTTIIPLTTTCKTTIPSTDITTSTCKTTSIIMVTQPPLIATTDPSITTCQPPYTLTMKSSLGENTYTSAIASVSTILSAESTPTMKHSSPISFSIFISTEKPYTESVTPPTQIILSSTQNPEELSEILPANTLLSSPSSSSSQLLETTTCKTTYSSLNSIESSSCKTTIHIRKSPVNSSEPVTKLFTQQPSISSHISSVSALASPLTKADLKSTTISHATVYSVETDSSIPITSIQTILESKKTDTSTLAMPSQTVKSDINTSVTISDSATVSYLIKDTSTTIWEKTSNWPIINMTSTDSSSTLVTSSQSIIQTAGYSTTSFLASTVSKSSIDATIFTTTSSPLTIHSPSDYEANVSLIPQEDSTILEQLTTKNLFNSQDYTSSQLITPSSTCRTTILVSDTTSTCKTTITAHSDMKENEAGTALSSTISIIPAETLTSISNLTSIAKEAMTSTCKTTEFSSLELTTTCKTTIPIISLPSITTCKTSIPTSIQSSISTSKIVISTPSPLLIIPTEQPSTFTTCKTTLLPSLLPTTTTCKSTILTSVPASTTTCKTTISTLLPTIIQTTTCKTTIPTTLPTTSTCKTTIPTEFPTIEPTIITLLPFSNQTISSFAAPISAVTSQVSPLSSSTMLISSSTSSTSILEELKNYTCKTTMISRSEYSQSTSLEITTPIIYINTEKEPVKISTQFTNTSDNFTTIFESSTSKIAQIPTSTSISLTEGLSSRLSTFISSLLPSDWRSSQNQPTSTYSTNIEQTDITSIFLSSLAPNKDNINTLSSPSLNLTTSPKHTFITDMAGHMFTSNLTTTTVSTFVTDIHGYIISSSIPPTELSNTILQAFTVPSTSHTTFRSHRGSTLASTNLFFDTTTLSAFSTIYSTPSCRSTAINGTGATCISTTTIDLTSYMPSNTSAESSNDIFDSRNATVPLSKSKPCLCINWYLICLIFTIAFIFAWCLLCWQKMLL